MDPATRADPGLDFVEEFASAAEWFAHHLGRTSARAPVPACVPWAVVDLTAHLGNTHAWAATILETGEKAATMEDRPASARSRRMAEWYLAKAEDLYEVLRATDPAKPCWNFAFEQGDAAFWARRQAHETLMHGIDLALAGEHPERLPERLAADGVGEVLGVFLWRAQRREQQRGHPATLHRAIELRAGDVGRSWVVEPSPVGIPMQPAREVGSLPGQRLAPRVVDGSAGPVARTADRIEAPVGTLLKLLWKRALPTDPAVQLVGDEERILGFLQSPLTP